MKTITISDSEAYLADAVAEFISARRAMALTGAGISVASGIPDFRSPGGVWTMFSPDEYATIEVFRRSPEKAWKLYRAIGRMLLGKSPNTTHQILAEFEQQKLLHGIITQNIDSLHQEAGNTTVYEIHGDHQHLHCVKCDYIEPVRQEHYSVPAIPSCDNCRYPLKPNIVLYGEPVRRLDEIYDILATCDVLLVIGTSASVYPAAGLPQLVNEHGGTIFEFNREPELGRGITEYFFKGDLSGTMPAFGRAVFKTRTTG